jgi:hypothetical protein
VEGEHHGRLAMEQTYGYLVREKKKYGVITTVNGWVFMYRKNGGELYTTHLLPCESTEPTIRQALYYISAMGAREPFENETDMFGNELEIPPANAESPTAAPQIPPHPLPPPSTSRGPVGDPQKRSNPSGLYDPRRGRHVHLILQPDSNFPSLIFDPSVASNQLGRKTFLATFMPEKRVVVGKFWDSWKEKKDERDREAATYMKLQTLWGEIVPQFLGKAEYEWQITLFVELIDVHPPLPPCRYPRRQSGFS